MGRAPRSTSPITTLVVEWRAVEDDGLERLLQPLGVFVRELRLADTESRREPSPARHDIRHDGNEWPRTCSKMSTGNRRRRSSSSASAWVWYARSTGSLMRTTSPGLACSSADTKPRRLCPSRPLHGAGRTRGALGARPPRRSTPRPATSLHGAGEDQQQGADQQQRALPRARRRAEVADEPGAEHRRCRASPRPCAARCAHGGLQHEQRRVVGEA